MLFILLYRAKDSLINKYQKKRESIEKKATQETRIAAMIEKCGFRAWNTSWALLKELICEKNTIIGFYLGLNGAAGGGDIPKLSFKGEN